MLHPLVVNITDEYPLQSQSKALQERLNQTNEELTALRAQFNESQKAFEAERTTWINDKKTLEDTIVDMSTSEKHSESDRSAWEQELKSLEDRAKVCCVAMLLRLQADLFPVCGRALFK